MEIEYIPTDGRVRVKNYAGSFDTLMGKIFRMETSGQIGPHVADRLIFETKQARDNGYEARKGGRPFPDFGTLGLTKLAEALEAGKLITVVQCDELIRLASDTTAEGWQIAEAGKPRKRCSVRRGTNNKKFAVRGRLHPQTPILVLKDLGLSARAHNVLGRGEYLTVADVPAAAVLLKIPNVSYEIVAEIQRVLKRG